MYISSLFADAESEPNEFQQQQHAAALAQAQAAAMAAAAAAGLVPTGKLVFFSINQSIYQSINQLICMLVFIGRIFSAAFDLQFFTFCLIFLAAFLDMLPGMTPPTGDSGSSQQQQSESPNPASSATSNLNPGLLQQAMFAGGPAGASIMPQALFPGIVGM